MATLVSIDGRRAGLVLPDGRLGIIGQPYKCTMAAVAGAANVTAVTLTVVDHEGGAVAGCHILDLIMSDAATGAGLTAQTASGNVVAGAKGVDLQAVTAKKHLRVQTDAAGVYVLGITDSDKHPYVICIAGAGMPFHVVGALVTASYGA